MLTKDDILSADDLPREEHDVRKWWPGSVFVRTLTGVGRDAFEQKCIDHRDGGRRNIQGLKALLVSLTVCGADGVLLFSEADIEALNEKSAAAIDYLYDVAARMNRLRPEDADELVGNSDGDQSA